MVTRKTASRAIRIRQSKIWELNVYVQFQQKDNAFHDNVKSLFSNFLHKYVALVTNRLFGLVCVLIWAIYIGFCVYVKKEIRLVERVDFSVHNPFGNQSNSEEAILDGFIAHRGRTQRFQIKRRVKVSDG